MVDKDLNLFARMQLVSNEIKNIEKNLEVGSGNYMYKAIGDLDVILKVNEAENKFGIISIPMKQELVKTEIVRTVKDRGGESVSYVDIVKMTLRVINVDIPTEYIDVESFGRGLDTGDKGFGKASTYARKYALLNAYKIASGSDPDKDKSKETFAAPNTERRDAVVGYLMKNDALLQKILSYYNAGSIDDFTDKDINSMFDTYKSRGVL